MKILATIQEQLDLLRILRIFLLIGFHMLQVRQLDIALWMKVIPQQHLVHPARNFLLLAVEDKIALTLSHAFCVV